MKNFTDLGINSEYIEGLKELNILKPTEIQVQAIPYLLKEQKDFIGQAQTGTGKTAAFGLPLLHQIDPSKKVVQCLILCPTRELGQQIAKQLFKFTKYVKERIFCEAVYGGEKIDIQIGRLQRPTHIIVATPGRLKDLMDRKVVDLTNIQTVVLDEADEMLSMGFKDDIDTILSKTNENRKTWLFSATIPNDLKEIISKYMADDAFKVEINKSKVVNERINHKYLVADLKDKIDVITRFIKTNYKAKGIIFCKTKKSVDRLVQDLNERGIKADAIHGDMGQRDREKVMRAFKGDRLNILVATDLTARGIDVANLAYVIHYQLPDHIEYYTHRSGRTARAGNSGISLILITPDELHKIEELQQALNIKIPKIIF